MKLNEVILSILITVSLGLCGFSLKWTFDANARIQVLENKLEEQKEQKDKNQDEQIRFLWQYGTWNHNQINSLRHKLNLEPAENPNF